MGSDHAWLLKERIWLKDCVFAQSNLSKTSLKNHRFVNRYEDAPPAIAFIKNSGWILLHWLLPWGMISPQYYAVGRRCESIVGQSIWYQKSKGRDSRQSYGRPRRNLELPVGASLVCWPIHGYEVAAAYTKGSYRYGEGYGYRPWILHFMTLSLWHAGHFRECWSSVTRVI